MGKKLKAAPNKIIINKIRRPDEDRDGPWNIGEILPTEKTDCPRQFY